VNKTEVWLRGIAAAVISGGANGIITGFAAIGIDPSQFNLAAGFVHTLSLAGVSATMSAIIGVAAYLKQSPLPEPYVNVTQGITSNVTQNPTR
jgi:hypothetical protein